MFRFTQQTCQLGELLLYINPGLKPGELYPQTAASERRFMIKSFFYLFRCPNLWFGVCHTPLNSSLKLALAWAEPINPQLKYCEADTAKPILNTALLPPILRSRYLILPEGHIVQQILILTYQKSIKSEYKGNTKNRNFLIFRQKTFSKFLQTHPAEGPKSAIVQQIHFLGPSSYLIIKHLQNLIIS